MKREHYLIAILCLTLLTTGCQQQSLKRYRVQFLDVFDTASTIVGYAEDEATFRAEMTALKATFLEYDKLFDIYHSYEGLNNLKTINDMAGRAPVVVDAAIIDLLATAKQIYQLTDGSVNIAFGSVLSIWHDYREAGIDDPLNAACPPLEILQSAAQHCNIDDVIIDRQNNTVFLNDPNLRLDVGAIAKGYGIECVAEKILAETADPHLLFSIGGNIKVVGSKATNEAWTIAIESPHAGDRDSELHLDMRTGALATSGDYQRYYTVNGQRYHHIIDPTSLFPAEYFSAVSVICDDATLADALSTALFNMDYERGRNLVDQLDDVEALWQFKDHSIEMSDGFAELLVD